MKSRLDNSLESEKDKNAFLEGVPAIVDAIRSGKILCRVYRKDKFHAKAYITHARLDVVGASALVGSSNFTYPGLTENIELNVQITGRPVNVLQEWYEEHWDAAEDVTPEILRTIERHTHEYSPFEVYAKALQEYFRNHEMTVGEWEHSKSGMYPVLDQYQKEGYQALVKIARQHRGAFLCDGVGLGKTFIGMMLIERLVMHERKRVMLLVPKAARKPVWESAIKKYLPHLGNGKSFNDLVIFNHTDLTREGEFPEEMKRMKEMADAVVIDEAHHFRNPGVKGTGVTKPSRYWKFFDLVEGKSLYFLTATPINNKLIDLQHLIELFSRHQPDYFKAAPLGIHSLPGHFRKMESELIKHLQISDKEANESETNSAEAEQVLANDTLFKALVVQRSRAYVMASQLQHGGSQALFPKRADPQVTEYSIKATYGHLLNLIEKAFNKKKPLFSLAIYYPLAYFKGAGASIDPFVENRQKQVVSLIRIQFLKRFESSAWAFEMSCQNLLLKLLAWVMKHEPDGECLRRFGRFMTKYDELVSYVKKQRHVLGGDAVEEYDEDIASKEMLEEVEELSRNDYKIDDILNETIDDLNQLAEFLEELKKFKPSHDDKLKALIRLLKSDPVLKKHKVLIFTEYMATARYLRNELENAGIDGVDEIDSSSDRDRGAVIQQFAPYYNDSSSADLEAKGLKETRVLLSTDVLSEGLNLQDATRLINYDIHWNPVRLMQRIGRVDRRMNPAIEKKLLADHPDQAKIRGHVAYWNFLPPGELDELLKLYGKVAHKTLRISKTFGIEGKKLLKPEDDYEALKDFVHHYEGTTTANEAMHLEYQKLITDYPDLKDRLAILPGQVFSGKKHPTPDKSGVFFCYALPAPDVSDKTETTTEAEKWSEDAGYTRWYLYDLSTDVILEDATEIIGLIRSTPETPRQHKIPDQTLSDIRTKLERHVKNTYLRQVQAPIGIKPILKCWMELS